MIRCDKHDPCPASRTAIRNWMQMNIREHRDPATLEVNCTTLAEAAAQHFDHAEWLGDSTNQVWDLAIQTEQRAKQEADRR